MKELYEDKYGQRWERFNAGYVYNKEAGLGVWDHGRGLVRITT
jgi:hypothetical protein